MAGHRGIDPESGQPADQPARDVAVHRVDRAGGPVGPAHHDGVGQVAAVEQRPAARRPAYHLDAEPAARVDVDVVVGLEATERQRGRDPAVEPQHRRRAVRDRVEQREIGRHLRGRVETAVEVVDEAPVGAQDSSVRRRYAAASRSDSSSAGSDISTTNIQPSPYGSEFTCSGVSSSARFVSTTRPDTGE